MPIEDVVRRKMDDERLSFRTNILIRESEATFVKESLCKSDGRKVSFNTAIRLLIMEKMNAQMQTEKPNGKRNKKS